VRPVDWILRAESAAIFLAGVVVFAQFNGNGVLLPLLILVPDISMVGYLGGPRLGAITYNLAHNLVIALALIGIGWFAAIAPVALAGSVLLAHVGLDRTFGYGLKLPTDFKDTHLGRIGR
jgi:Domain of unknown function (DUF4260)